MDAELAEVLRHWTGAWRYPRLWVLLSRGDDPDISLLQLHMLNGISFPATADDVWRDLIEPGEFFAAERLFGYDDFLDECSSTQERLRKELEQSRKRRAEQLREQSWLVQRRADAVGLREIAERIKGVPHKGQDSVPLALQSLRRAEESVETAEAETFVQAESNPDRQLKPWPFSETPHQMILSWLRESPGAPRAFKEWMPRDGDTGAEQLIHALWWMWGHKPAVDPATAERVGLALVQFLGFDEPRMTSHIEPWCMRVSLAGMAPTWLPSFLWQPQQCLDIFIAHAASASEPAVDLAAPGLSLLLDPFDAVETIPKGVILLSVPLLFQLMREPVETRADMLLVALGRQVDLDQILPVASVGHVAIPGNWPQSDLAIRFFGHSAADETPSLEESRRFLQLFLKYHGIRCERGGDLDRISFYAGGLPPLVLHFVRLLLGRAVRRGPSRPFLIKGDAIEEVRASADWQRFVKSQLLIPIGDDPVDINVLQPFLFELQLQGMVSSIEGSIRLSVEDIAQYVEMSFASENISQDVLQASLGRLEHAKLIARSRSDPAFFLMSIPIAAVLTHLIGDGIEAATASTS